MSTTTEQVPVRRSVGHRTWALVAIVVGNAAVQALLVAGDPTPNGGLVFGALVTASTLSVILALWLISSAAATTRTTPSRTTTGRPADDAGRSPAHRRFTALSWSAVVTVAVAAGGIGYPLITPVIALAGVFVLTAAAHGSAQPVRDGMRHVRTRPAAYLFASIAFCVLVVASWLVAVVLGLLVTGVTGAFLTWLWFGATTAVTLRWWSWMYRAPIDDHAGRPTPSAAHVPT